MVENPRRSLLHLLHLHGVRYCFFSDPRGCTFMVCRACALKPSYVHSTLLGFGAAACGHALSEPFLRRTVLSLEAAAARSLRVTRPNTFVFLVALQSTFRNSPCACSHHGIAVQHPAQSQHNAFFACCAAAATALATCFQCCRCRAAPRQRNRRICEPCPTLVQLLL
jgi:hypothetical protein